LAGRLGQSRSGSRTGRLSGIGGAAQQLACQTTCARACPFHRHIVPGRRAAAGPGL